MELSIEEMDMEQTDYLPDREVMCCPCYSPCCNPCGASFSHVGARSAVQICGIL